MKTNGESNFSDLLIGLGYFFYIPAYFLAKYFFPENR